ncbi:MAG: ATP-binding protein [Streptomyces sp.]|nr:ATP-binding protein [Streptomyces sp.]
MSTEAGLKLDLIALPKAVPEARRMVREYLGDATCPEVELCVAELLTNVIRHVGEGTFTTLKVTRDIDGRRTRVEVTDSEPHSWLVVRHAGTDEESGRGLFLLDALASRWGVEHRAEGKTVWCELLTR